jgi:organic hydroperoxide reductase OsmC/OhrA
MAHEYTATVRWRREPSASFTDNRYSREHVWVFDGGTEVPASPSPGNVPAPWSRADAVDPEEGFVAALSSCHMLFFLAFAAKRGFVADSYEDHAVGIMERNERAKLYVSRVTLDPKIAWSGDKRPSAEEVAEMHHRSHEECYLANSVRTEVVVAGMPAHHA